MLPPGAHFEAGVNEVRRLAVRRGLTATNGEQSAELRRLYAADRERSRAVEVYLVAEDGAVLVKPMESQIRAGSTSTLSGWLTPFAAAVQATC